MVEDGDLGLKAALNQVEESSSFFMLQWSIVEEAGRQSLPVRSVGCFIALLTLLVAPLSLRASPELDLSTRFVQGYFDVLLPDGWVAALDGSGSLLLAEGPGFSYVLLSPGWDDNEELFLFHDLRVAEINAFERLQAFMIADSANGPEAGRQTVLELSWVQSPVAKAEPQGEPATHHVQISRPASGDSDGVFASLTYQGDLERAELWAGTLNSILDSMKVKEPREAAPPRYQDIRVPGASVPVSTEDLIGDWVGAQVLGDVALQEDRISTALLSSAAPDLKLLRNGRYISEWHHFDFDIMKGVVDLGVSHEESGRWRLVSGGLELRPSRYKGEIEASGQEPEAYDSDIELTRRYGVTLLDDAVILRGPCAEYQMLPDCVDPFSGEPRVLGFVLKQRDER